jgi:hypothetical protein
MITKVTKRSDHHHEVLIYDSFSHFSVTIFIVSFLVFYHFMSFSRFIRDSRVRTVFGLFSVFCLWTAWDVHKQSKEPLVLPAETFGENERQKWNKEILSKKNKTGDLVPSSAFSNTVLIDANGGSKKN